MKIHLSFAKNRSNFHPFRLVLQISFATLHPTPSTHYSLWCTCEAQWQLLVAEDTHNYSAGVVSHTQPLTTAHTCCSWWNQDKPVPGAHGRAESWYQKWMDAICRAEEEEWERGRGYKGEGEGEEGQGRSFQMRSVQLWWTVFLFREMQWGEKGKEHNPFGGFKGNNWLFLFGHWKF